MVRASRRSRMPVSWTLPDLPRNRKRTRLPSIATWRSRRVVSPNERFRRAYSSLPTRMNVSSRRRTTAASTFSRGRPVRARSASTRSRIRGSASPNSIMPVVLRRVAGLAPARVIAVLLAAAGIAARRLDVAVGARADPHVGPGGRDCEAADPLERGGVGDPGSVGRHVAEPLAPAPAADPRIIVVHVPKAGLARGAGRVRRRIGRRRWGGAGGVARRAQYGGPGSDARVLDPPGSIHAACMPPDASIRHTPVPPRLADRPPPQARA